MTPRVTDLRLVTGLVVAAMVTLLAPGVPRPVEFAFGVPLLVLLPGYAVVAALFPERPGASVAGPRSPDWPARFGLSLVGSAVVVAMVGVLFASQGLLRLTLAPAVLTIGAVTMLAVAIAAVRRGPLGRNQRADPVALASPGSVADGFGTSGGQSLALVLSVLVLVGALAFAGTSPAEEPYSEVYLTDGEDVDVGPYNGTQTMVAGAGNTVSIALENHEGEATDYRVLVRLQRVDVDGTVLAGERLDDFRVGLAPGETGAFDRVIQPTMTGERLRLQVLVFAGGTAGEPDADSADLALRVWVDVTDAGTA